MAIMTTESRNYTAIADAIRSKNGETTKYLPEDMAAAIEAIPTGGGEDLLDIDDGKTRCQYRIIQDGGTLQLRCAPSAHGTIDWGDGSATEDTYEQTTSSYAMKPHVYAKAGLYTITIDYTTTGLIHPHFTTAFDYVLIGVCYGRQLAGLANAGSYSSAYALERFICYVPQSDANHFATTPFSVCKSLTEIKIDYSAATGTHFVAPMVGMSNQALRKAEYLNTDLPVMTSRQFNGCTALQSSNIRNLYTNAGNSYGYGMFQNCHFLSGEFTLTCDNAATPGNTFFTCYNVDKLTIKGTCTEFTANTISSARGLKTLVIDCAELVPLSATLSDTPIADGTGYLYVPDALVEDYKVATNWTAYAARIKPITGLPEGE